MKSGWMAGLIRTGLLAAAILGLPPGPSALAQPASLQLGGDTPIDVVSEGGFEFHEKEKVAIARGGAMATQGDMTLKADTLAAYFRESAGGGNEIYRLAADGNVEVRGKTQTAYGARGVYDVDKGVAVLTGGDLRLVTETDVVTAKDSLEFWRQQNLAVARGDAVATREENRLRADRLVGLIEERADGTQQMTRIDADGNVVVTTPQEVARGDRGTYDIEKKLAILTGNVKITRGQNQLNGKAAEVNLETGISRLLSTAPRGGGATQQGGDDRVRGLFIPQSTPQTQPAQGATQGAKQP